MEQAQAGPAVPSTATVRLKRSALGGGLVVLLGLVVCFGCSPRTFGTQGAALMSSSAVSFNGRGPALPAVPASLPVMGPVALRPAPRGRLHNSLLRMVAGRRTNDPEMTRSDDPEIDPRRKEPERPGPGPGRAPMPLPMVGAGDDKLDVMSRLLRDRIVLLGKQVDDEIANLLVAQLLYLANEDPEKDITLYINSPGGSVSAGMAIFDTMQFVPCDTNTVCFGTAASMGAFLLGAGTKGKRRSLPNSRIMIHQPLGGAQGQAADIEIQAKEILFIRALLCEYIADYTGQPVEKVEDDCDRDFFMTPDEAKDYGIIDEVLSSKVRVPNPPRPELMISA